MSLTKRFCKMVKATMSAVAPSSAVGIAEGQAFSHDSVYRVLRETSTCLGTLVKAQ